jgi:hypothetical protein
MAVSGVALAVNASPLATPPDPESSTTLEQRIDQRKKAYKAQLSAAQQQAIKTKCSLAQTTIQDLQTKDTAAATARRETYTDLATQLNDVIGQLKKMGVDTTQLETSQKQFNDAINIYLTDAVAYRTATNDAVVMDCAKDPSGFEANLMALRQLRSQLAIEAANIKVVRPALIKSINEAKQSMSRSAMASQRGT